MILQTQSKGIYQELKPIMSDEKSKGLVSIVVPCFNHARYLGEALGSAFAQTFDAIEIMVVDDGSTDDTALVATMFADRISYWRKPNGGPSSARNFGLTKCRGEFVIFLDADDLLLPTYVERLHQEFAQIIDPKFAFAYTQMELFGTANLVTQFPQFSVAELKDGNYIHASAMLRTDIARIVGYDETLRRGWEDWSFYLSLVELGYYGRLIDQPLLRYRQHRIPDKATNADPEFQQSLRVEVMSRHRQMFGLCE